MELSRFYHYRFLVATLGEMKSGIIGPIFPGGIGQLAKHLDHSKTHLPTNKQRKLERL
jgi:hypothetical protein